MKLWALHGALAVHGAVALAIGAGSGLGSPEPHALPSGVEATRVDIDFEAPERPTIAAETPRASEAPVNTPSSTTRAHVSHAEGRPDAPSDAREATLAAPSPDPAERFSLIVGAGSSGTAATGPARDLGDAPGSIVDARDVSEAARISEGAEPSYPEAAREEGREADVGLEIVVDERGEVVDARVTRRAGDGFDEAALDAMRRARFTPARRQGRPVRVRLPWTVTFRLR